MFLELAKRSYSLSNACYVPNTYRSFYLLSNLILFLKDFIYLLLERGEGREKKRERNIDQLLLVHTQHQLGPNPQPRCAPLLATFHFVGRCPTIGAPLVR